MITVGYCDGLVGHRWERLMVTLGHFVGEVREVMVIGSCCEGVGGGNGNCRVL